MKKLILLPICLLYTTFLEAQNIYYESIILSKKMDNNTNTILLTDEVKELLLQYYPQQEAITRETINENPFLKDLFDNLDANAVDNSSFIKNGLKSVGNLDVTNLADGFAKFFISRTKEELNVAFFSRFHDEMKRHKHAQLLFPQTNATLNAIGSNIYNYQAFLSGLRESFEKDLNSLLANLPEVLNDSRYAPFFASNKGLKSVCLSAIYIGNGLLNKEHPGSIIANFDTKILADLPAPSDKNIPASIKTLQLFSESLRSIDKNKYWIDSDSLKILTNDPITLQIYFGLIYQKSGINGIEFSNDTFQNILEKNLKPGTLDKSVNYLEGFIKQTSSVTKSIRNISGKDRDKLSFSDYYDFYNSSLNLVEYASKIDLLPGVPQLSNNVDFKKYLSITRAGGNVALDIYRKNYGSAIINIYTIYDHAFKSDTTKAKAFILKYGSFIATVSEAENSDDVAKAIEAAALPSGSSRIKRETAFNVSLNGYLGLFLGSEKIQDIKNKEPINSYGITAPIGVALSWGHSLFFFKTGEKGWRDNKHGWSSSVFISLVDIGAVAAYRFEDNETAQIPTIKLKNIFSPGAFISIGIPKTPLSFNLGAQIGPNLRKIDDNKTDKPSADFDYKTYVRYSASLCMDIPLLNFFSKTK